MKPPCLSRRLLLGSARLERGRGWRASALSILALCGCALGAAEEPPKEPAREVGRIEIDPQRGEVRFPCWFVNPSRKLEVFACHESGPTHETVVAFAARGEEIHRALREVGFRGAEHWNATSPEDLALTGGDRAVVWLRWEWKGAPRELAAEELLIEEGTGLPLFVRGFTFAAGGARAGEAPRRIPDAIELTIGGVTRQSAAFSMLYHPNDLPALVHWSPAPEVSPGAAPELKELVESRTRCELIIRRLGSEKELVELALARETDPARRAVRERERAVAGEIDGRKREFETLGAEVRRLLDEGEKRRELSADERKRFEARSLGLLARGRRLALEIRELYLRLWDQEEAYRLAAAGSAAGLNPDHAAWLRMAYHSGFRFDLAIAGKQRESAALEGDPAGAAAPTPERTGLLQKALRAEIEALNAERERRWARFKLETEFRPKLRELDPVKEEYVTQLFRESELRALADMRAYRAGAERAQLDAAELRARAAGSGDGRDPAQAKRRAAVEARALLAEAEREDVESLERIRWARNPPGGQADGKAEEEIEAYEAERKGILDRIRRLRSALEAATGRPVESAEDPPEDLAGSGLFPAEAR